MVKLNSIEKKIVTTLRKGMTLAEITKGEGNYKGISTYFNLREKVIKKKINSKSSLYPALNKLVKKGVLRKDSTRDGGSSYMVNVYGLTDEGRRESDKMLTVTNRKLKSFSVKPKFKRHKLNFKTKNINVGKMNFGEKKSVYTFSWSHKGRNNIYTYKAKDYETAKKEFKRWTVDFEHSSFPWS